MENVIIKQAVETKILRYIIIDQHLSWKCHISLVSTKMLKKKKKKKKMWGLLRKLAFICRSNRCWSYCSLVYPNLKYCNMLPIVLHLDLLQKCIVRPISKAHYQIPPHFLTNLKSMTYIALILFRLLHLITPFTIIS